MCRWCESEEVYKDQLCFECWILNQKTLDAEATYKRLLIAAQVCHCRTCRNRQQRAQLDLVQLNEQRTNRRQRQGARAY
jgi:hypothetical protein